MKKIMGSLLSILILSSAVYAEEVEVSQENEAKSNFYIIPKLMFTTGSTIEEEDSSLEGAIGGGLAVDFGYNIAYGFAAEVDATYAQNTITEKKDGEADKTFSGSYTTSSFDIAYKYEATEALGVFAKIGYEVEFEKISELDIDNTNQGFTYAAGAEYEVAESLAILGEYEHTTIDGPRGDVVFAGVEYSF